MVGGVYPASVYPAGILKAAFDLGLSAASGSYSLTGASMGFVHTRYLELTASAYTLQGSVFYRDYGVTLPTGSYSYTGSTSSFILVFGQSVIGSYKFMASITATVEDPIIEGSYEITETIMSTVEEQTIDGTSIVTDQYLRGKP